MLEQNYVLEDYKELMIKTIIGRGLIWILITVVCLIVWPIMLMASDMAPDPVSSFILTWVLPVIWLGLILDVKAIYKRLFHT